MRKIVCIIIFFMIKFSSTLLLEKNFMTFEQYKSKLNEAINSSEEIDVDFSTILGLLAQYNLRLVKEDKREEFSAKYDEIRKGLIIDAYNADAIDLKETTDRVEKEKNHGKAELKRFEVAKKLLEFCDMDVVTNFAKENRMIVWREK